jgi:hypothetical protein
MISRILVSTAALLFGLCLDLYVLWNATGQIQRPSAAVAERAQRFCNLIEKTPRSEAGAR